MNKIFLKTREHDGVFYKDRMGMRKLGEVFLNIVLAERIIFENITDEIEIKFTITFYLPQYDPEHNQESFMLLFTEAGGGEYQRYKREIESLSAG